MSEEKTPPKPWKGPVLHCKKCGVIYNNLDGCPVCSQVEQLLLVAAAAGMNGRDDDTPDSPDAGVKVDPPPLPGLAPDAV